MTPLEQGGRFLVDQIADMLREMISDGRVPVGGTLPSYNAISKLWGVSVPTVQRAVGLLRDEGLVQPQAGRGTVVLASEPATADVPQYALARQIREMRAEMAAMREEIKHLRQTVDAFDAAAPSTQSGHQPHG